MLKSKPILKFILKQKIPLSISFFIILFRMLIGSFIPKLFGKAIDSLIYKEDTTLSILGLILILSLFKFILFFYSRYSILQTCEKIKLNLKSYLFKHILSLKNPNFSYSKRGKIIQQFTIEIEKIIFLISHGFNYFLCLFFILSFTLIQMYSINLELTLISTIPIFTTYILLKKTGFKIYKKSLSNLKTFDHLIFFLTEKIHTISLFKNIFSKRKVFSDYHFSVNKIKKQNIKLAYIHNLSNLILFISIQVSLIFIIAIGYTKITNKSLSIGELTAFLKYVDLIGPWLLYMEKINPLIFNGYASIKRFDDILKKKVIAKPIKEKRLKPHIQVKNLSFKYSNQIKFLFKNLNIEIFPNDKIALFGKVGSGKTTFIKLLFKSIHTFPHNSIFIQNIPIEKLKIRDLTKNFLYIQENSYIFDESILNNITIFKKNSLSKKTRIASKIACISKFIKTLPNQYYENIGDAKRNLSTGQKQRIHISRIFFPKNKDLIILDTPFSNLDLKTERNILKRLYKYYKNKTIIIVSPNILDKKLFNRVLYIEDKKIIEKKPHI